MLEYAIGKLGTSTCPIYPVLNLVARYEYLPNLHLKYLILNLVTRYEYLSNLPGTKFSSQVRDLRLY